MQLLKWLVRAWLNLQLAHKYLKNKSVASGRRKGNVGHRKQRVPLRLDQNNKTTKARDEGRRWHERGAAPGVTRECDARHIGPSFAARWGACMLGRFLGGARDAPCSLAMTCSSSNWCTYCRNHSFTGLLYIFGPGRLSSRRASTSATMRVFADPVDGTRTGSPRCSA